MQRVAILNSRQALRPTGNSDWLLATVAAIKKLSNESEYIFLASLGETTYEMTLYQLIQADVGIEIVLTEFQMNQYAESKETLQRYLASEFNLESNHIRLVITKDSSQQAENPSHLRDITIANRADVVVPISIRQDGFWNNELANNVQLFAKVDSRFAIPYQRHQTSIKKDFAKRRVNPQTALQLEDSLIHWTRATNYPWPGERRWEFYRDLANAQESYPRSAHSTLERILKEKQIRGSERHMPNSTAMVAMTSASLVESVALMKYRARYREMTIEPYAIAIPQKLAIKIGARQVQYYAPSEMKTLSEKEKLFAHSSGSPGSIWEKEKEWRVLGNIDLTDIWREILVLTEDQYLASSIEREFGLETLPVF